MLQGWNLKCDVATVIAVVVVFVSIPIIYVIIISNIIQKCTERSEESV